MKPHLVIEYDPDRVGDEMHLHYNGQLHESWPLGAKAVADLQGQLHALWMVCNEANPQPTPEAGDPTDPVPA